MSGSGFGATPRSLAMIGWLQVPPSAERQSWYSCFSRAREGRGVEVAFSFFKYLSLFAISCFFPLERKRQLLLLFQISVCRWVLQPLSDMMTNPNLKQ